MFRDNLKLFVSIIIVLLAMVLLSTISSLLIPILIIWTLILVFYYPYARLCKVCFKGSKAYSRCWRRLYRYVHFKQSLINKILLK